ncbi:MAG TPA: hypothetical protein PKW34_01065 [Candidatus Paceibacterota bacterium]|nr:hypothetical protein [Candidatus Paceibacterota bacterium]HQJ84023.1 hypothetical protein [Candidatus Paceibacterota bacterium]
MNNFKNRKEAGLVKLIILIIVVILILSYLGINIQKIAESETGQANFGYLWNIIKVIWEYLTNFWNEYLKGPAMSIFGKIPLPPAVTEALK